MQSEELPVAVRVAARMRKFVDVVGAWGAWLIIPVVAITCIDVIGRKIGYEDEETGRIYRLQGWLADKTLCRLQNGVNPANVTF